jgi:hypothetical protein
MWNIRHVKNLTALAILCALLPVSPRTAIARAGQEGTLREQRSLVVHGARETWQLMWVGRHFPLCPPEDMEGSVTEPCHGIAYGEYGNLWLVRRRDGHEIERMNLKSLFGHFDYPDADRVDGKAYVQRWPMRDGDPRREGSAFVAEVKKRPVSTIMKFADYDRDGHATEFLIQVGTLGGGVQLFAAVGVSTLNPHLHALASVEKPGVPVEMQLRPWKTLLRASRPIRLTTWQCDDHSSPVQQDLIVSARQGRIHFREILLHCPVAVPARSQGHR